MPGFTGLIAAIALDTNIHALQLHPPGKRQPLLDQETSDLLLEAIIKPCPLSREKVPDTLRELYSKLRPISQETIDEIIGNLDDSNGTHRTHLERVGFLIDDELFDKDFANS